MTLIKCPECNKQVSDQAKACPHCGIKLKKATDPASSRLTATLIAVAVFIVLIIIGIAALAASNDLLGGKSLYHAYTEYCVGKTSSTTFTCKLSDNNKSLSLDTNPQDKDGGSSYKGSDAVRNINRYMGFPEALNELIGDTSYNDGRITREYNGYEISWKYHPDSGLEIIYVKK